MPLSGDEFVARVRAAGPPTADDVSITLDCRRLDSKEGVLAWLAEVEAERAAGHVEPARNNGQGGERWSPAIPDRAWRSGSVAGSNSSLSTAISNAVPPHRLPGAGVNTSLP